MYLDVSTRGLCRVGGNKAPLFPSLSHNSADITRQNALKVGQLEFIRKKRALF
jgi:hypothetical protein